MLRLLKNIFVGDDPEDPLKIEQKQETIKEQLLKIEQYHVNNNTWHPSLNVNIELLQALNKEVICSKDSVLSTINMVTGLKNINQLFIWTKAINSYILNREQIGPEVYLIRYHRNVTTLSKFLVTDDFKKYPIDALLVNLTHELISINNNINSIEDTKYKDKITLVLNPLWVDVSAIVNSLCVAGVTYE